MAFEKYQVTNNAYGNLLAGIGASDESAQLGSSEGDRFPDSGQAIGTLVQYDVASDPTSDIVKQESVLITNKSGDVFTITRGFGGDTATGFNAGDWLYVNVRAEIIDDVYGELDRLESDKANDNAVVKLTGNQTVAGNKTFTGTTATQDIDADGTVTATEFSGDGAGLTNVTSDINNNTTDTSIADTDFVPFYDVSATSNDKITLSNLKNSINKYKTVRLEDINTGTTTTTTITHGLGAIPQVIRASSTTDETLSGENNSTGTYTHSDTNANYLGKFGGTTFMGDGLVILFDSVSVYMVGNVTTNNATTTVITWTKTGSPATTGDIILEFST